MFLLDASTFCADTAGIWGVLGWVVMVFKIVIPLLLIIFGMVDLGKAVISSDDKAISKAVSQLVRRFIAAVVLFFIPTIVSALFNAVAGIDISEEGSDWNKCVQCVTNVTSTTCESDVSAI